MMGIEYASDGKRTCTADDIANILKGSRYVREISSDTIEPTSDTPTPIVHSRCTSPVPSSPVPTITIEDITEMSPPPLQAITKAPDKNKSPPIVVETPPNATTPQSSPIQSPTPKEAKETKDVPAKRGWKKVKVFGADEEKEEPSLVARRSSVCLALDPSKDLAVQMDAMAPGSTVLIHGHEMQVQQAKEMLKVCRCC